MSARVRSRAARAVTAIALVLVVSGMLWAHARLVRSSPFSGETVATAPHVVTLWFSEAPELALSTVTLADSLGHKRETLALERGDSSVVLRVLVREELPAGTYTVAWRVAASDGHPSSGTFKFMVAAAKGAAGPAIVAPPAAARSDAPPSSLGSVEAVVRATAFVAVLLAIGGVVFELGIVERAPDVPSSFRDIVARERHAPLLAPSPPLSAQLCCGCGFNRDR